MKMEGEIIHLCRKPKIDKGRRARIIASSPLRRRTSWNWNATQNLHIQEQQVHCHLNIRRGHSKVVYIYCICTVCILSCYTAILSNHSSMHSSNALNLY